MLATATGSATVTRLFTDFQTNPLHGGWESSGSYPTGNGIFDGEWDQSSEGSGQSYLRVRRGLWQTPLLPVHPFAYFRLRFSARTTQTGFYAVRFFDAKGNELISDEHNAFEASETWQTHEVFTQAREEATAMRVAFIAGASAVVLSDVTVSEATAAEALAWNDALYATLPPVRIPLATNRWQHLDEIRATLERGGALRLLVLGDSIANDMANSLFHLLLQRHYPGSAITLIRSIRGATGCEFYQHLVRKYVTDKRPDLVIIAGISHQADAAAIRSVVNQTRKLTGNPVPFLVLTGAIMEPGANRHADPDGMPLSAQEAHQAALAHERHFFTELEAMRAELGIATLDMRSLWEDYLFTCGQPRAWYQRDRIHANARGKQIMGRILEQFFARDTDRHSPAFAPKPGIINGESE